MTETFIDNVCYKFNNLTKKPEKILSAPEKLIDNIKELIKETYDFTKKEETTLISNVLPALIVDNFDVEQIWQQVELQNNNILTEYLNSVSRLVAGKDKLWFLNNSEENIDDSDEDTNENENSSNESLENGKNNDDSENGKNSDDNEDEKDSIEDNVDEDNNDTEINELIKPHGKKSIVDDEFFKLDEMEEFLKKEERITDKKDKEDSEDEESVDLFDVKSDDLEADDDDSEEDEDTQMNPKYDDFFGEAKEPKQSNKRKRESEELDDANSELDENEPELFKSSLEMREERLHKKIGHIEESALHDKPWQLKGEITADKRPQNSLLQEYVDFDMTVRPAPVITEEVTLKLEDIIKNRIKDKVWDDVERKIKPVESPLEYKKKLMLDQEKSKQSLAQIYETEYLKQKEALDPDFAEKPDEEPKEHIEIKSLMKNLFMKLDALSNFHFTPKSAAPELRIVNNLPAISMEEVAPVATSDATLLAPEEVKKKSKGDVIGKAERTDTDKNRERRQKKLKQREHANEKKRKEKIIEKMRPGLGNKYSKQKAAKLLDKVTKDRNVDKMDETSGATGVKSSTAFFTQLQEEVRGQIKSKTSSKNKKTKEAFNAKKLKM